FLSFMLLDPVTNKLSTLSLHDALPIYDFDPESVPVPYNHSNVMADEVIYYANAEFMSRKGIEFGSLTLHPDGLPHGPHPGRVEESIGQKRTDELAVMMDRVRPLHVGRRVPPVEDRAHRGA